MNTYKVTDIFSYLPDQVINLEQIEQAFFDSLVEQNNIRIDGYDISVYFTKELLLTEDMLEVEEMLIDEKKMVAYIGYNNNIFAILGYVIQKKM